MSQRQRTLMLCLSLLVTTPVTAKTIASIDSTALEARWQNFAKTAAQTQPAVEFPYAHCFKRAAATQKLPETLLLAVARGAGPSAIHSESACTPPPGGVDGLHLAQQVERRLHQVELAVPVAVDRRLADAGAGGHAGTLSPFALVREVRQFFDGPIALSGSITV